MAAALKHAVTLGFELDDARVSSARYKSADTLLGHDLILWEPEGLLEDYTYLGNSLTAEEFGRLESDQARRQAEMNEHLEAGRPLVLFVPDSERCVETISRRMSLADLLPLRLHTTPARGQAFDVVAGQPFSGFWEEWAAAFEHQAVLVDPPGTPLLRIRGTSRVVAAATQVGNASVLLLPGLAPHYHDLVVNPDEPALDTQFLDAVWKLLEALQGDTVLPEWSESFLLPTEEDVIERLERSSLRVRTAEKSLRDEESALASLRERKLLFTGSGIALEAAVEQAFEALGFTVEPGPPGRTDRLLRRGRSVAVVEIKGKTKSASERDAAQLEKWVSAYHADFGKQPKGILVVNAWRNKRLDERSDPTFPDQMLAYAADQREQCLITSLQLLLLWLEVDRFPSKQAKLARSILECVGRYPDFADWTGAIDEAPDDGETS